jgi:isocitrate dehydrogenase kinase/phosphatase
MTAATPPPCTAEAAAAILEGYRTFRVYFQDITARALDRFVRCDWPGLQADAVERLDAYQNVLSKVVADLAARLGPRAGAIAFWEDAKALVAAQIEQVADPDLAETFFNSVVRRLADIVGADPRIEFLRAAPRPLPTPMAGRDYQSFTAAGRPLETLCRAILQASPLAPHFAGLERDARRMARAIARPRSQARRATRRGVGLERVDMLPPPFFRGMGAYLIGRMATSDGHIHPLAVALTNDQDGLRIDGVIDDEEGIRLLFSYTHSYFHVLTDRILELIAFLWPLLPHRRLAELYISLGFNRHGKTELYRDLAQHQNACRDIFEISPGKPGMVMAVFNMPSDDLVFKVIRDRFAQPKRTTRREVMAKYTYIFRHDRTGRLPDTQTFEHLKFARGCFHPRLLQELEHTAAHSVAIDARDVAITLAYVERRVHPLDLYLAAAPPEAARRAVIDFGQAIKDLAYSNLFPGDMLLKNFGVTGLGRVIFYDFDEVCPLTECRFRRKPPAASHEDELSAEPWYYVAENDVFPEEFENFLGLPPTLKEVFMRHHKDLLGVDFWRRTQDNIRNGVPIHVFPYTPLSDLNGASSS